MRYQIETSRGPRDQHVVIDRGGKLAGFRGEFDAAEFATKADAIGAMQSAHDRGAMAFCIARDDAGFGKSLFLRGGKLVGI